MGKRSFYLSESELDDCQTMVLRKKVEKPLIVTGCAGSGKSLIALWKAKEIQNLGHSFLYVVYTKTLRNYMQVAIDEIGLNNACIYHYHEFFRSYNVDDSITYDYVIIDEAQDFSKEQLEQMISKAKIAVHMYGDSDQQLYSFRRDNPPLSMEEIKYFTKYKDIELIFNHRLPKKIARFAQCLLSNPDDEDLEARCRREGNNKPKVYYYQSFEEQLKAISNIIKNNDLSDVGILFSKNDEVLNAYNFFKNELNIEVECKTNTNTENIDNLDFKTTLPKLMTYHSSKGLQFEDVFLPECSEFRVDNKNALYVAATRTYNNLYIMHSGNLSPFIKNINSSLYENIHTSNSLQSSRFSELDDNDIPF